MARANPNDWGKGEMKGFKAALRAVIKRLKLERTRHIRPFNRAASRAKP